ncbi:beta-glucoside-specific PTS transporter subunit IIABC [Anaerorhabdus sp.]|uniref:beta-glucoside-specific PTS transporter subunit IIABC n=1 Tax=Anaerorhabdus sp. TaxID=1872524 RepID=UPI002FC79337
MNNKELAKVIIDNVGGESNIKQLSHCFTRLRFTLSDDKKANIKVLESTPGISGVVTKGGQFQVVIGSEVGNVYREINNLVDITEDELDLGNNEKKEKLSLFDKFVDIIQGIFTPILAPLTAAGMLKAVLAVIVAFKWIDKASSSYQVINFMADATFYFLPILLANSAAKKFKCNPYLAMMLAGMLLHPNFTAMVTAAKEGGMAVTIFGLPIYNATYSSSVIPIILGVYLMSKVEPIADKISPKAIKFFTRPLITMFVVGVATLCVLGPIGYIISNFIATCVNTLNSYVGWLVPTVMGIVMPLLVMTGTHHSITPIGINNRMTMGYDTIVYPGQLASNVAQGAAALAVSIKTKNSELKQLCSATGITAVCGITEPVLFGVTMKIKTNLIASMIGGGVGGLFLGVLGIKNFSGGSPGLLTLPSYISTDAPMSNFYLACAGAAIAFVVSFAVSYFLYKEKKEINADSDVLLNSDNQAVSDILIQPIKGEIQDLCEVKDETFSKELMGKGAAIIPTEGKVYSPVDGEVFNIFRTKHAISLKSNKGADIIIHVGLDTVKLDGKYFNAIVKNGDHIKKGDLLLEFDIEKIKEEGYDLTTPVVVVNANDFKSIKHTNKNSEFIVLEA